MGYRCGVKKEESKSRILTLAEEGGNASNYRGKLREAVDVDILSIPVDLLSKQWNLGVWHLGVKSGLEM